MAKEWGSGARSRAPWMSSEGLAPQGRAGTPDLGSSGGREAVRESALS